MTSTTSIPTRNLLERYLQAVGLYLPPAHRADTLAELRANLLDQLDALHEDLGHPPTTADIAAVLVAHGKPELVALRYLPQRSLIGPTVFPFYVYTLRKVLPLVVVVYAIAKGSALLMLWLGSVMASKTIASLLIEAVFHLVPTLLLCAAIVTAVFAVLEFTKTYPRVLAKLSQWDPMSLPAVHHDATATSAKPRSLGGRLLDLILHCFWMAYVLWVPHHLFWIFGPGLFLFTTAGVTFAPVWHTFYLFLIALLTVQLIMKLVVLRDGPHPWFTPLKIVTDVFAALALGVVAFSSQVFVAAASVQPAQLDHINHATLLAVRIALIFAVIGVVKQAWHYAQQRKAPTQQLAF